MNKDAELVKRATECVRRCGFTTAAQELEALAQRLEAGVVVPKEPTETMTFAGRDAVFATLGDVGWSDAGGAAIAAYRAMTKAAP